MDAGRDPLLTLCRVALVHVERAESFSMADWLAPMPDGRTLRQRYAEAATLAWELDRQTGGPPDALPGTEHRTAAERERRPVLMLVRELRECLGRVAARLEAGADLPIGGEDALQELVRLSASSPGPSLTSWERGRGRRPSYHTFAPLSPEAPPMEPRILGDLIAQPPGNAPFLISPELGVTLSYARFMDEVNAACMGFQKAGVQSGDAVGIVIPNGLEVLIAFFGALHAGAAAQPINPDLTAEEIDFALEDSQSTLVITTAGAAPRIAACRALPERRAVIAFDPTRGTSVQAGSGGASMHTDVRPEMDALLLYTSGTTSRPKGVPLTHANLLASAQSVAMSYALKPEERTLCVMPLFHVHGLVASVFATMVAGGAVVVPSRFSASNFWPLVRTYGVSWYTAVPTIHTILLATADENLGGPVPPLRFVRSCSSALAPATQEAFEARFQTPVLQAYGMTEASHQMATNPLPPGARKEDSVGLPTGVMIAILDEAGTELPHGAVGEVSIRGPNVTRGYLRNPEATAEAFTNGWFRTGDSGTIDADGYVFLQGRIKELINRGGEKISPLEVDAVLLRNPDVREAVTVGVPHPIYGEEVEAVIALQPGASEDAAALIAYCKEHLAPFKVPKAIRYVPEIPRSATGKVQRRRLLDLLG